MCRIQTDSIRMNIVCMNVMHRVYRASQLRGRVSPEEEASRGEGAVQVERALGPPARGTHTSVGHTILFDFIDHGTLIVQLICMQHTARTNICSINMSNLDQQQECVLEQSHRYIGSAQQRANITVLLKPISDPRKETPYPFTGGHIDHLRDDLLGIQLSFPLLRRILHDAVLSLSLCGQHAFRSQQTLQPA